MKRKAHLLPCMAKGQDNDKSPHSDHTGCDSPLSGHLLSLSVSVSAWDSAEKPRKGKGKKKKEKEIKPIATEPLKVSL